MKLQKCIDYYIDYGPEDVGRTVQARNEVRRAVREAIEDIIGRDEGWRAGMGIAGQDLDAEARNELRAKQRERLEELYR